MSVLDSIKPFWPLLFTFVLPRALGYFSALKTAYRTRPPPKRLPPRVDRSLNILFCSVVFFLIQSLQRGQERELQNVFSATNSRLGVTSDVLFARLAMIKPDGILSATEELLRGALTNKDSRLIYLTYGPSTLLDCSFCHPSQPQTYVLYHLPTNVFLPHVLHFIVVGLATSALLTSPLTSKSRTRFLIPAVILLAIDVYLNTLYTPFPTLIDPKKPAPFSLYVILRIARPLSICFLDGSFAFYIWATTTNRFLFFPFLSDPNAAASTDVASLQIQAQELVGQNGVALQTVQAKLRAFSVARNTVLRDASLKANEDAYWREVIRREGQIVGKDEAIVDLNDEIYQDEDVQAAIARVCGGGGIDVPQARREASAFVDGVTRGLEDGGLAQT